MEARFQKFLLDSVRRLGRYRDNAQALEDQRRHMGSGARAFPGGINKWQKKRKLEQIARQKERILTNDIRDKEQWAVNAKDKMTALANRFVKEGAEDLWNDDDGPFTSNVSRPDKNSKLKSSNPNDLKNLNQRKNVSRQANSIDPALMANTRSLRSAKGFDNFSAGRRSMSHAAMSTEKCEEATKKLYGSSASAAFSESAILSQRNKKQAESSPIAEKRLQMSKDVQREKFLKRLARFDQCKISPFSLRTLEEAGFMEMTDVQKATIPAILEGNDVLARARPGIGKIIAFLLPAVELVLSSCSTIRNERKHLPIVLVLCPTCDLCSQIAAVANTFLRYHSNLGVQVVTGVSKLHLEQKKLEIDPCQILVATPGRLLYHIDHTPGFSKRLMSTKMLILDEADQLLRLGYRKDLEMIIDSLPRQRQALLFTSTTSEMVQQLSVTVLKRGYSLINALGISCLEIHDKVMQKYLITSYENHIQVLCAVLTDHIAKELHYKVLVFCPTMAITRIVNEIFSRFNINVKELHSQKCQTNHACLLDELRIAKNIILLATDVSARRLDCPDVTLVVHMGMPRDRRQYIYRLSRTRCQDKIGESVLLITPWEEGFLSEISDVPLQMAEMPEISPDTISKVEAAVITMDVGLKEAAYLSWLEYYNSIPALACQKSELVQFANKFALSLGLQIPPPLSSKKAKKMGLTYIPGVRIA